MVLYSGGRLMMGLYCPSDVGEGAGLSQGRARKILKTLSGLPEMTTECDGRKWWSEKQFQDICSMVRTIEQGNNGN